MSKGTIQVARLSRQRRRVAHTSCLAMVWPPDGKGQRLRRGAAQGRGRVDEERSDGGLIACKKSKWEFEGVTGVRKGREGEAGGVGGSRANFRAAKW